MYQDGLPSDRHLGQRSRIANHGKKSRCSTVSSALAHALRIKWQPIDRCNWAVTHGDAQCLMPGVLRVHTREECFFIVGCDTV